MAPPSETAFVNRTRRSPSISRKLLMRGRLLEVPLYFALRRSDLAREGIDHSGSWRFAAHIYRGEPSGRGRFGRWLDGRLLAMPAARSFRSRYLAASDALARFLIEHRGQPVDVLSAPCGLPLELGRAAGLARQHAAAEIGALQPDPLQRATFHGLDLDPDVLDRAGAYAREHGLPFLAHEGDALSRSSYPAAVDFITCTGFGEFLDDERLARLFGVFHDVLRPGGWLLTSGMQRHWASAYLLRLAELETHYRSGAALAAIVRGASFREVTVRADAVGLQSLVTARA